MWSTSVVRRSNPVEWQALFVLHRWATMFCASMYTSFHRTDNISICCVTRSETQIIGSRCAPAGCLRSTWKDMLPFVGKRIAKLSGSAWTQWSLILVVTALVVRSFLALQYVYFLLLDGNDIQVEIQIVDFLSSVHVVQILKKFSQGDCESYAKPGILLCFCDREHSNDCACFSNLVACHAV